MSVTPTGREEGEIQAILLDSGLEEDADLRRSLEELRGLAQVAAPAPREDLAALLTPGVSSLELRRRNRQRRMGIVVSAAVVGAMGLGAGAVAAASEDFRRSVGHTVVRILQPVGQTTTPKTDTAPPAPTDMPPLPGQPGTGTVPSAPVQAGTDSPTAPAVAEPGPSNGSSDPRGGNQSPTPAPDRPAKVPAVPGTGAAPKLPAKPLPSLPSLPHPVPGSVPTAIPADPVPGKP
ncbi:MAG: hypothetical protein QOH40_2566 [Arthrobacter pascens]|nr:hypothetical protein [Arthrobacter pascens]